MRFVQFAKYFILDFKSRERKIKELQNIKSKNYLKKNIMKNIKKYPISSENYNYRDYI